MKTSEYVSTGGYLIGILLVIIGLILFLVSFTTKATSQRTWALFFIIAGPIISIVACMYGGGSGSDCASSILNNFTFGRYGSPLVF